MNWQKCIRKLFRQNKVMTLEELRSELEGRSRASVFRDLSEVGYVSSYSHKGKCFTLKSTPSFSSDGVWHFDDVGFSQYGTLKNTVAVLVEQSEAGFTHSELQDLLQVRVHNTLLSLFSEGEIGREEVDGQYLYVSKDAKKAQAQLKLRETLIFERKPITAFVPSEAVIEILAEVIRVNRVFANARDITTRLISKGIEIATAQVEQVLKHFDVKKKRNSK